MATIPNTGEDIFERDDGIEGVHTVEGPRSMEAGITKTFRARYPEMYEEHRRRCKAEPRRFSLGG